MLVQSIGVGLRVSFPACSRKGLSQWSLIFRGVTEPLPVFRYGAECQAHNVSRTLSPWCLMREIDSNQIVKQMSKEPQSKVSDQKERDTFLWEPITNRSGWVVGRKVRETLSSKYHKLQYG